jgi:hypothetical protein
VNKLSFYVPVPVTVQVLLPTEYCVVNQAHFFHACLVMGDMGPSKTDVTFCQSKAEQKNKGKGQTEYRYRYYFIILLYCRPHTNSIPVWI